MTPVKDMYAKKKIASIPKGPAVGGAVMFNKAINTQKLTTVSAEMIIFNIA